MMRVVSCITMLHDLRLVALAAIICIGGGWVTFELLRRARDRRGRQKSGWLFLAAVACGSSVWCTHFIAILAYDVAAPVTFDPQLTMLSLLIVIAASALGFRYALAYRNPRIVLGGMSLGGGISAMHYSGMMAYHVDGIIR